MLNLSGLLLVEKLVRLGLRPTVLFDFVTLRNRSCQRWDLMNSRQKCCSIVLSCLVWFPYPLAAGSDFVKSDEVRTLSTSCQTELERWWGWWWPFVATESLFSTSCISPLPGLPGGAWTGRREKESFFGFFAWYQVTFMTLPFDHSILTHSTCIVYMPACWKESLKRHQSIIVQRINILLAGRALNCYQNYGGGGLLWSRKKLNLSRKNVFFFKCILRTQIQQYPVQTIFPWWNL